jgi:hypothetical protein
MAKKEPFTPIWNFDDEDGKKGRKKMTIKELDRERGKREADKPMDEEIREMVDRHVMWAQDRANHEMTSKKEKIIAVIIVIAVLAFIVLSIIGRVGRQGSIYRY